MYSTTAERSSNVDFCRRISLQLNARRVISITWMMGLVVAVPPLVGWSHYAPEPNGLGYVFCR